MLDKTEKTAQQKIDDWVYEQTGGVVQSGPFAGIKLALETTWRDTALAPMLLGTFEQDLHGDIEREIARLSQMPHCMVTNVGCAEGYYAVGLAKRLSNAEVHAVDINDECLRMTAANAEANGCSLCFGEDAAVLMNESDLIVMDCEGDEYEYLDIEKFPGLAKASIIVEVHNMRDTNRPHMGDTLVSRFSSTHFMKQVLEGPRNPNVFPFLFSAPSGVRLACVHENRPCVMDWYVMKPKTK